MTQMTHPQLDGDGDRPVAGQDEHTYSPTPQQGGGRHGRPGWAGVATMGVGAAVLSSLLTAGAVHTFGTASAGSSIPATTTSQSAPLAVGSPTAPNWVAVASAVEPSVVAVKVVNSGGSGDEGSGVLLDTQGHVLTNNHVIAGLQQGGQLTVTLSDGRIYDATVTGTDPSTDLAVLTLKTPPNDLKPAAFADSSAVNVGDRVMAIGNPLGLSDTATTGIVSALNRPVSTSPVPTQQQNPLGQTQPQAEPVVTDAIQTDAPINPGNSGGALVDSAGKVIGITSSIASLGGSNGSQAGSIGLGFAIPANEVQHVAQALISKGTVQHAFLGITVGDTTATVNGAQQAAAEVGQVTSGSPAAAAGLKAGDKIIAIGGQPVNGADSLVAHVRAAVPGNTVNLTVVRGGSTQTLKLTLGNKTSGN